MEILLPKSQISHQTPKIIYIDCGLRHFCMITQESELLVCGNNKEGQLGIGTNNDSSRPVYNNLIDDPISQVSCGVSHTLVLTKSNKLFGFGANDQGQLGVGSRVGASRPVQIYDFDRSKQISGIAAGSYSGFVDEIGRLFLWGFGDEEFQIPQFQEFVTRIANLYLNKENCCVIDEFGNVLTLEDRKYAEDKNEFQNCFALTLDNKNAVKVACGNNFFLCVPDKHFACSESSSMKNNQAETLPSNNLQNIRDEIYQRGEPD